ncbi:hypothetical protein NAPIS_ORF00639 [Vairimorpha apis BRL 01]|uniref:Uncharacterized protein n=1 Tax=Vairimorpha apis BRL 01 TaxID=1037528 RepID=T0ML99_9MICR|nr:hypothetical protein NAPIS_ORF00639 [Vairimorpha apis BRL 01]
MNKVDEIIEKCKDKYYISKNKSFLREYFNKKENIEFLINEMNSKRNYTILNILERINFSFESVVPSFDSKNNKFLTYYMYSSIFWMYKKNYISCDKFDDIKLSFQKMKNFAKMFEDTENHYIMYNIEKDRKIQKQIKDDFNAKNNSSVVIQREEIPKMVFFLNVDNIFDFSNYTEYDFEYARDVISDIKHDFSKLININNTNIHYIRNKYQNTMNLYTKIDRRLNRRLSKLYNDILQNKKHNIDVKLVSKCSILQLVSEITFFRFDTVNIEDLYTVKDKNDYENIFKPFEGMRIVVFEDKNRKIEWKEKLWYLDAKYFHLFNTINKKATVI